MKENLTNLEYALIKAIIVGNAKKFPSLIQHFDSIYVTRREHTGVGIYVYFGYKDNPQSENIDCMITSDKSLSIKGLENEISYVLDIIDGRINYLELVTNGEDLLPVEIEKLEYNLN